MMWSLVPTPDGGDVRLDGLTLEIDQDKLTKKGKAEAIKALEEAAAQLKG